MKRIICILTILLFLVTIPCSDAQSIEEDSLLVDYGNGKVVWYDISYGDTVQSTICATLRDADLSYILNDTGFSEIGGAGTVVMDHRTCGWNAYIWMEGRWERTNLSEGYNGGHLAICHCLSDLRPVSNPYYPEVWQSFRGDPESSGVSSSYGPETVATPLEWYRTFSGHYVDTSIVCADGYLYFVTEGEYSGVGNSKKPTLYCIDAEDGSDVWRISYPLGSYDLVSPLIVSDYVIMPASNGHIYAFDRSDGSICFEMVPEGEQSHFADFLRTGHYAVLSTSDENGDLRNGRTFDTGPTNVAYDSGCLYLCMSDGSIRAFTLDSSGFRELWYYLPDTSQRGSFYYSPPVVTSVDGRGVVLAGNYSGNMYCVDASTGSEIWVKNMMDLTPLGMDPGSVRSISPCGDGTAIVSCNDGSMTPYIGYLMRIDLKTGDTIWKKNAMGGNAVIVDGVSYIYLSPSAYEKDTFETIKGGTMDIASGFYAMDLDANIIWHKGSNVLVTAGMTYADGVLYAMDYSAGSFWPYGGGVTAIRCQDGSTVWRVKVEPSGAGSYSMVSPTVIDGKVFVGNDLGAVYCISTVRGTDTRDPAPDIDYQSEGLVHWSWWLLTGIVAISVVTAVFFYRRAA